MRKWFPSLLMLLSVLAIFHVVKIQAQELLTLVRVPRDTLTIQQAIYNLADAGTVEVEYGTYCEYVRIHKSLTLTTSNKTIIDGKYRNYPDSPWQVYALGVDNLIISGFTFLTTYSPPCAIGIRVENCKNVTITNCIFEDTCCRGIELVGVSNALIFNNTVDASGVSLLIYHCTNVTVTYNTLRDADQSFHMYNSREIIFHHNNVFFEEECSHPTYPRVSNTTCTWDDGREQGNYWSDYADRYPNATRIGEVWDTPYQIDPDDVDGREHFDYYPLVTDPPLLQLPPIPDENPHGGCPRSRNCVV